MNRELLWKATQAVAAFFPDVPADFYYEGQTWFDRVEGYVLYAIEQLEEDIEAFELSKGKEKEA